MALVTGTPKGSVITQDEIYLEGAPNIYYQDATATPLYNPDGDSYYWGMSGTSTYPVYQLSCYTDVALSEDIAINVVRCDTVGDKSTVQKRNYLELTVSLQTFFPLTTIAPLLKISTPATGLTDLEKAGIGKINNNKYYMVYLPKVYDDDTGDYVLFHLHRCQFVDAWTINMRYGENWQGTGLKIRAYADENKPANQIFGVIIRADPSAIS